MVPRKFSVAMMALALVHCVAGCSDNDGDKSAISPACQQLLTCYSRTDPNAFKAALASWGEDSTCWASPSTASACQSACTTLLKNLAKQYPTEPACTATPVTPDGGVPKGDSLIKSDQFVLQPLPGKEVDVLFVIDSSGSMEEEQTNLAKNFPDFIKAFQGSKFKHGLPNLRIGVVNADLGAGGKYQDMACMPDGDKGKLQHKAMSTGCLIPKDPYIEHKDGTTNITGATGTVESQLAAAFTCIAKLGTDGCGFEQTLASAKKALSAGVNPNFLRKDSLVVIVFITDEDDCSASNNQLFDPNQQGLNDPLGPLTSFRCFEFGVTCTCPGKAKCDRFVQGARTNCVPAKTSYLYHSDSFVSFFKGLRTGAGHVIVAAIAGPTDSVSVGQSGSYPVLKPSCTFGMNSAAPAVRIKYITDQFAKFKSGHFSNICSTDYSPALTAVGKMINERLTGDK